ncbi:hypothetical protein JAB4_059300 (plasmid) [Janthinobacterium sp. HH102]|uniref:type 4 pilus major pilin n=1 Tax=Janthinobacterium sp. HH102 TaxID=1537274 RepID=UPI000893DA91|nr:type 4 pilus major pilin [Janthinobacterium sp. HH102]QOU76430.1 hypothetical protein JAB4_059300 [Janthinobacterium sp. HH102]
MKRKINKIGNQKFKQRGISAIQIMLGVLVGALVLIGGLSLLRWVDSAKVNNDLSELNDLKARTVSYALNHNGSFSGVTQETIIGLDFFPSNRVSGASGSRVVQNQWKGLITVAPATTATANDSLLFTYTGITSAACKELSLKAAQLAAAISVGGTPVKPSLGTLNEATMITSCDQGNDNVTIAYTFNR